MLSFLLDCLMESYKDSKYFNGFSLIDVHKNATLSDCFEGDRSRVIGNGYKK